MIGLCSWVGGVRSELSNPPNRATGDQLVPTDKTRPSRIEIAT